jgi:hypothetical protein
MQLAAYFDPPVLGFSGMFDPGWDWVPGGGLSWSGWGGKGGDVGGENSPGPRVGPHLNSLPRCHTPYSFAVTVGECVGDIGSPDDLMGM